MAAVMAAPSHSYLSRQCRGLAPPKDTNVLLRQLNGDCLKPSFCLLYNGKLIHHYVLFYPFYVIEIIGYLDFVKKVQLEKQKSYIFYKFKKNKGSLIKKNTYSLI